MEQTESHTIFDGLDKLRKALLHDLIERNRLSCRIGIAENQS